MSRMVLFLLGVLLLTCSPALATPPADVASAPTCRHCGMDRDKFGHSRMLIEYEDGSKIATCSLHCAAVELAITIDRIPVKVSVADYNSKVLLDADEAIWVIGGNKKGVMTAKAKWAFADRAAAESFIKSYGGSLASFDEAIKAAYDDMYQDTKMIREFRKMKRIKANEGAHQH